MSQRQSCREHFKKLKILTAPCLYILVCTTDLVKHLHRYESATDRKDRLNTRRKDLKVDILYPRLNILKHSPRYQAVLLFNRLPLEFKQILSFNQFKNKLKKYLVGKCYYSVDEFLHERTH